MGRINQPGLASAGTTGTRARKDQLGRLTSAGTSGEMRD